MHRMFAAPLLALTLVGACGTGTTTQSRASDLAGSELPSPPPATPSATSAAAPTVVVAGDAETNPACKLAGIPEMEQLTGLRDRDILGITAPGSNADHTYSCTWHFEDTDLNGPAVVVGYEIMRRRHPELVAYLTSLIGQHLDQRIPGFGDVAVFDKHTVEVVDGRLHVNIRAQLHDDAEEKDLIVSVLRLVFPRMPRPGSAR
jgi:hypothetical protein